ncbi:hypothetical protein WA026_002453 [Henosepilachna vigintioctopunctata]|uniref:Uncharacterized protein n=1 Tax=Henosepilachna vigintioctopunctata TaxID=420089 RepID=A0AAW1TTJ4_9CUCU
MSTMFKNFVVLCLLYSVNATHFITKINETVHHNVILEINKPWDPEMYAKKVILSNATGVITSQTFQLLTELQELYLVHSSIEYIHQDAFKTAPKLENIQFSYNSKLPFLTNDIFKNCKNLKKLVIGNNKFIEGISDNLCSGLQNLTHVEITKESKIPKKLTNNFFRNSKSLESIKLHFSNITSIDSDAFKELKKLNFLSLVENEVNEIGPGAFGNENLLRLYLSWNKLKYFSGEELQDLRNLEKLDISFNPLIELDVERIKRNAPNLKSLSVAQTSLSCNKKKEFMKKGNLSFHVHIDRNELEKCEA